MSEHGREALAVEGPRTGTPGKRGSVFVAVAIAAAVPLAFNPSGYFVFLPIKWTLATALVAAGLGTLILERRPLPRPTFLVAWGVLLLVLIAAAALGIDGLTSWIGYPGRYLGVIAWIGFCMAFLLGAALRNPQDRARVILAATAASIVVSIYALLQAVGVDPVDWDPGIDTSRSRSTLGNAAFLGGYLAMVVPLAGRLALSRSGGRAGGPRRARRGGDPCGGRAARHRDAGSVDRRAPGDRPDGGA